MRITISSDEFLISDIEWPTGSLPGLPDSVVVSIPYYLLDEGEEDDLDDFIIESIFDMTGARPSNSFSFEPV